jgi:hypothetical protein
MHRRLILAGLAATGGLLTSAFLQVAVAAADTAGAVSATGADAFTIDGFTFDPFTSPGVEGWNVVPPLSGAAPFLTLGGGTVSPFGPSFPLELSNQDFEVYNPATGADLGTVDANDSVSNLFGLTNAEFVVTSDNAAAGGSDSALPTVGSVYDEFNLGNGYENVYTDIVSATGGPNTVTDTLITPHGDINLDSLFGSIDAAAPMQPGDAFTGLEAGDSSIGADAFTIGGVTLDPTLTGGGEGFEPVSPLTSTPPVLTVGGGSFGLNPANPATDQDLQTFNVYSGDTSSTEVGTITTGEDVTNLLGFTNTQLVVTSATAADGGSGSDLPTVGSIYDAFNFGNGVENVYTDIPGTGGGADTVTDTLVTPFGNINLDSLFGSIDAAAPMQPADAFTGLEAGDSSIGADAFTINDTTFDPILDVSGLPTGGEGWDPVYQILGVPPLMEIGGGTPYAINFGGLDVLDPQWFDVYSGSGSSATEIGTVQGDTDVLNLLGMTNTEFTVGAVTGTSPDLPTDGTVYDAFNFGDGITNVYTAVPGVDGAPDTITDELVTPFGNFNLDSLFGSIDAIAPLNPGDAFGAGLDAATAAATEAATSAASAIDPLSFLGL